MTFRRASFTRFSVRTACEPVQLRGEVAGQLSRIEMLPFFTFTVPPVIVTGRAGVALGAGVVPGPEFTTGPGVTAGGGVTTGGAVMTDAPLTVSKLSRTSTPASEITESLPAPPEATSLVLSRTSIVSLPSSPETKSG